MTHKIAHIADIHFRGYKRHKEYRQVMEQFFSICKTEKIDAFVIAGDIVHSKTQNITPELIEILTWWFNQMSQIAPVHVTLGNHDGLLTNLSRQDTVSPVINAINSDRIFLYKDSGVYPILDGECDLVVFSPFDEDRWDEVKSMPLERDFSVAVYHGAVTGCVSDSDWALSSDVDVSFFAPYDFAMLGDIHKRQDLDPDGRVAYPGSMIQQNFGETREKGFLLWEIESRDKWEKQFVELDPVQPYVTIDWQGDLMTSINRARLTQEDLNQARVRIRSEVPLSQVETREVAKTLRDTFDAHEAYFKHEAVRREASTDAEHAVMAVERDPGSLTKMIIDFGYSNPESTDVNEKMTDIIREASKRVIPNDSAGGKTWSLGRMEWDNTYGYGEGNHVDFTDMNGLIGVFGQNRVGKSSIPATVLYTLFNTSDRGLTKNTDIVNVRKSYCKSKIDFSVGADRYEAERQTVKKTNKKGITSATTHLNLALNNSESDTHTDMNGEQRRDTDKELQGLLGTVDDFVLTAFATQGDGNNFIAAKPTARQEILARFLQLDFFGDMYEVFRDTSSGIRRSMSDAQDKISKSDPSSLVASIKQLKEDRDNTKGKIEKARQELEKALANSDPDRKEKIEASKRRDGLVLKRKSLEEVFSTSSRRCETLRADIARHRTSIEMNRTAREEIDTDALHESLASYNDLNGSYEKLDASITTKQSRYDNLKKSVELLKKVPCGDQFPKCRFIKDSHNSKQQISEAAKDLKSAKTSLRAVKRAMSAIDIDDVQRRLHEARSLDEKLLEIERSIVKLEANQLTAESARNTTEESLKRVESELQLIETRWDFSVDEEKEAHDPVISMTRMINDLERKEQRHSETIGSKMQELRQLKELSETVTSLRVEHDAYEILMRAFSKSGIPSHLVTLSLPVINKKLSEILFEDCGFTIELESDEGSKKLDIYIDYGDSKRKIECTSGMERMIASLSLRTVLHSITHLSKPDFMILDEGFGALDDSNVEVAMKMLRSMLDHFRFILIISHVETVKEAVDEMIEVSRVGLNSWVQHG